MAQNPSIPGATLIQPGPAQWAVVPISATAAVNTATTLTIPAPAAGLYNYICMLGYDVSNDGTATAITAVVSTSTNFNSFAVKLSQNGGATSTNIQSSPWFVFFGSPSTGCAKSTSPSTATTFVSPAMLHASWNWYASYYQAP